MYLSKNESSMSESCLYARTGVEEAPHEISFEREKDFYVLKGIFIVLVKI